jgi:hypothetical protein
MSGRNRNDVLQPTGVLANWMTVSLMISSGREEIKAERIYHCLPANMEIMICKRKRRIENKGIPFPRKT